MASNDPTDTGGLFVGRRPGTGPLRYRGTPAPASAGRRTADRMLAYGLLAIEVVLCLSLWGPQPMGWLWVASQVDYQMESITAAIVVAFTGMLATLFITLALLIRVDYAWRLVRRAAGYEQRDGALNKIFIISLLIIGSAFVFWFFVIEGPGPSVAPSE